MEGDLAEMFFLDGETGVGAFHLRTLVDRGAAEGGGEKSLLLFFHPRHVGFFEELEEQGIGEHADVELFDGGVDGRGPAKAGEQGGGADGGHIG